MSFSGDDAALLYFEGKKNNQYKHMSVSVKNQRSAELTHTHIRWRARCDSPTWSLKASPTDRCTTTDTTCRSEAQWPQHGGFSFVSRMVFKHESAERITTSYSVHPAEHTHTQLWRWTTHTHAYHTFLIFLSLSFVCLVAFSLLFTRAAPCN